jgi:HlyD family secretion protein
MKKPSAFAVFGVLVVMASIWMVATHLMTRGALNVPKDEDRQRAARQLGAEEDRVVVPKTGAVSGPGIIEPRSREVRLAAPNPGLITRMLVEEGAVVKTGQLLLELEAAAETAALASAQAEVASAARAVDRAKTGERAETIAAAANDAQAQAARASQSSESLARLRQLAAKELATRDELDRARYAAEQDAAALAAARSRHQALAAGPRVEDIAIEEARLALARKKVDERKAALALRRVHAPQNGTVLQIKFRAGEYFTPGGDPLLLLGDTAERRARVDIDERDIARIRVGDKATITAPAFPQRLFPAHVVEVGQRIGRKNIRTDDPRERIDTKILEVVLALDEPAVELLPGLRITAVITSAEGQRP